MEKQKVIFTQEQEDWAQEAHCPNCNILISEDDWDELEMCSNCRTLLSWEE